MKKYFILIKSVILIAITTLSISCNNNPVVKNNDSLNRDLSTPTSTFVVSLMITQTIQTKEHVLFCDSREVTGCFIDPTYISFSTLPTGLPCTYTAYCRYEWNNYSYYVINGLNYGFLADFLLPTSEEIIAPNCEANPPGSSHHGPCSSSDEHIVSLSLQPNTQYQYKLGLIMLADDD